MSTLKKSRVLTRLRAQGQTLKPAFLLWLAGWMLTGCASGTPPIAVQPRPCPANLTYPCTVPPPAKSGSLTDLLTNHIEAMELYQDCRDKQEKLAECVDGRH